MRYAVVQSNPLVLTKDLPGQVSSFKSSEVRPQVTGIIQARLFEEGGDVKAGQVLYQIDPALFQADYNNAEANLQKAMANEVSARLLSERYAKIIKSNAVSRQEYDNAISAHIQAKASVEAARQALESTRINLEYTRVTAPVSGRISRSFVTPGALVVRNQPQPLAIIQQIDVVYVDVSLPSTSLLTFRRAMQGGAMAPMKTQKTAVRLRMEDGSPYARSASIKPGEEPDWITGEALFADVSIDKSAGVVNIRTKFENPRKLLLPGMHVRAIFKEGLVENAVLAPQRAVMFDIDGSAYAYVLKPAPDSPPESQLFSVEKRPVSLQRNIGSQWLISSGLAQGDLLLLDGHIKTRPGAVVKGTAIELVRNSSAQADNATQSGRR